MKRFDKYLIILIILIAAFLRLWNLGSNPPHLSPDEAALGYNAYSIFKTGKDEYGMLLPVIFKSFGDFKPGFYIYFSRGAWEINVSLTLTLAGILLFLKSFKDIKYLIPASIVFALTLLTY